MCTWIIFNATHISCDTIRSYFIQRPWWVLRVTLPIPFPHLLLCKSFSFPHAPQVQTDSPTPTYIGCRSPWPIHLLTSTTLWCGKKLVHSGKANMVMEKAWKLCTDSTRAHFLYIIGMVSQQHYPLSYLLRTGRSHARHSVWHSK